jgi:hypothetical protein
LTFAPLSGKIKKEHSERRDPRMKITKRLLPLLLVILSVIGLGCGFSQKSEVRKIITGELDLLKNMDSDAANKYISYQELFPDATEDTELSPEIKEVFSLFFQNFDYDILDINIDNKKKTATASIRLSTLDAPALSKDFATEQLKEEILEAADSDSENTKESTLSLENRYLLLNSLLKNNNYDSIETSCKIELNKTDEETWEIRRTDSLENDLVGGLITCLSDQNLLSPEETLTIYLDILKEMNPEEMSNYLGVESILNTSDHAKNSIASALVEQVHKNFNYEFKNVTTNGYRATIETVITTFDSDAILSSYQDALEQYLSSTDAVIDGYQKRYDYSYQVLLENIENNTATCEASAVFELINDGTAWKLKDDDETLGSAIFGTLSTSPVEEDEES